MDNVGSREVRYCIGCREQTLQEVTADGTPEAPGVIECLTCHYGTPWPF